MAVTEHLRARALAVRRGDTAGAESLLARYAELERAYKLSDTTLATVRPLLRSERIVVPAPADGAQVNLLVVNVRHHTPGAVPVADEIRLIAWLMDLLSRRDPARPEIGLQLVIDLQGVAYAQLDTALLEQLVDALQSAIPATVKGVYLVNASWYFALLLRVVLPLLRPKIASRLTIVSSKEQLLTAIPAACLPVSLGGSLVHNHVDWLRYVDAQASAAAVEVKPVAAATVLAAAATPAAEVKPAASEVKPAAPEVKPAAPEVKPDEPASEPVPAPATDEPAVDEQAIDELAVDEPAVLRSGTKGRVAGPSNRRKPTVKPTATDVFAAADESEPSAHSDEDEDPEQLTLAQKRERVADKTKYAAMTPAVAAKMFAQMNTPERDAGGDGSASTSTDASPQSSGKKPKGGRMLMPGGFDPSAVKLKKRGALSQDLFTSPAKADEP